MAHPGQQCGGFFMDQMEYKDSEVMEELQEADQSQDEELRKIFEPASL